jgi:hypothetical protein
LENNEKLVSFSVSQHDRPLENRGSKQMKRGLRMTLPLVALIAFCADRGFGQAVKLQPDKGDAYVEGPGVRVASLVHAIPAVLPDDPTLKGEKYVCTLLVVIGADGAVKQLAVANRAPSAFDKAAITAVRQSQFEPGSLSGTSVSTRLLIWVPFFGDDRPAIPVGGPIISGKTPAGVKTLTPPVPENTPEARFSDAALRAHIESGVVSFQVLVDENGKPRVLSLLAHAGWGLDENAFAAVREYRFKPATLSGIPVPFLMSIVVKFHH